MSSQSTRKLLELFEQELRELDARTAEPVAKRRLRVSRELEQQVVAYAAEVRTDGSTPEQMLVDLKAVLSRAAPEIPSTQRSVLMAELTGRAIDAFFARHASDSRR